MTTRRGFFRTMGAAAGGIAFCSCGLLDGARAQATAVQPAAATPRPPVLVGGKRVRTVDTHAHCYFREAIALMGPEADGVLPPVKGVPEHFIVVEQRLAEMDAQGVDMQVLSINPFWYGKPPEVARQIAALHNERLAELCAQKPDRFAAFGSLTLQVPEIAVRELEDAVKRYGLKGAAVGASLRGEDFSDPKFHPVWAKAEELGATIFIHPQSTPQLAARFKGNGWLSNVIGNPLDTTIALQKLIFEGTLDRFPKLKLLAAHGGGYFGSYKARSDHSCFVSPKNCDPTIQLKKKPSEYVDQIFFDSLVFTPEALAFLVSQVGASQVVVGSDHPIPWAPQPVDHVLGTTTLSDADKVAILSGNAARLLGLPG